MRLASVNNYKGEGVEVTELDDSDRPKGEIDPVDKARKYRSMLSELTASNGTSVPSSDRPEVEIDPVDKAGKYRRMLSELTASNGTSVPSSNSFDESMRRQSIFREIERSLSDEDRSSFFLGSSSKFYCQLVISFLGVHLHLSMILVNTKEIY
jgi:rRNA maturation protein Nop10